MATNGGVNQVNLNFVSNSGEYPFLNHLKTGAGWSNADGSAGGPKPDNLDSNGYPKTIPASGDGSTGFSFLFDLPSNSDVPWSVSSAGQYVILTDGQGTIACTGMVATAVSGTNNRLVYTPSSALPTLTISAINPADQIRNIRVVHINDEASLNSGNVFGVKFKQRLIEGKFSTLRFLNWANGNNSNLTKWSDRTPQGYVFYGQGHFICDGTTTYSASNYYVGDVTPTVNAFAITTDGTSSPVDRQVIHFRGGASAIDATVMTLNLNGTGALPIKNMYGSTPGGNEVIGAKRIATVIFDKRLNAWLKFGGDTLNFSCGITSGVPHELRIRLCTELGADLWDVSPFLTTYLDSGPSVSDFWSSYATAWKNTAGTSGLLFKAEVAPNECWQNNNFGTAYAQAICLAKWGLSNEFHQYVGMCASLNGQVVSSVFGGDTSKYRTIVGVQQSTTPSSSNNRLNSARYVTDGGSAAYNWVTHIAPSSYVGATLTFSQEIASAYAFSTANTATQASLAESFARTSYLASGTGSRFTSGIPAKLGFYQAWIAWAKAIKSSIGMYFYEGSWSPDYFTVGPAGDSAASAGDDGTASLIIGATKGTSTTILQYNASSAVPAVGMQVYMSSVTPFVGMTDLNPLVITAVSLANPCVLTVTGNAATALGRSVIITTSGGITGGLVGTWAVTGVSGQNVTLSLNASGFTGTADGTALARPLYNVTVVSGQNVTIDIGSNSFGNYTSGGQTIYNGVATLRNALRSASKQAPSLAGIEITNARNCITAGGSEPSLFQLGGLSPSNNVWSALETIYQTPNPPKWEGFRLNGNGKRRLIW